MHAPVKILAVLAFSCLSAYSAARQISRDQDATEQQSAGAQAQDFNASVVPITSIDFRGPFVEAHFGTGFCLDRDCRFVGTSYHVAVDEKCRKIEGIKILQRYLATGPNDENATLNNVASGGPPLRYALSRDLAVFEMTKPLPYHRGLRFSAHELRIGQEVDIYAYPMGVIDPFRSLHAFHGTFKGSTDTDLLAFDYVADANKSIRPGASGGIIVDSGTGEVVGILNGVEGTGQPIAMAVPVESLAEFLNKELPFLAEVLFPIRAQVPEDEPDFYPKYDPPPETKNFQSRPAEPNDITELRERAQALAEGMRNFIAVQTYVWGTGNQHPAAADAYEIQVRDSEQMFRQYPNGKTWSRHLPRPEGVPWAISTGDLWSTLPTFIGTHVGVKIREAAASDIDGQRLRVFQYLGNLEDNPCVLIDVGFLSVERPRTYAAYGEVWTDRDLSIVRMSLHCERNGRQKWQSDMNYGWLTRPGVETRLVPVTVVSWSPIRNEGRWCRSQFVNYREFVSRARLLYVQQPPVAVPRANQHGQSTDTVRGKLNWKRIKHEPE